MTVRRCHGYFQAVLVGVLLCTSSGLLPVSHAQVTSSGLSTVVTPSGSNLDITGGTRPGGGTNLFHSFGDFSLAAGEAANFLNNSGLATSNILARVTAGNPSNIFGTINTLDFGTANLFLLNPAGVIFGPTARLDVGGSFHATTANYLKLGNDGIFYADPGQASTLTASPPSAFGFLTANPASIEVLRGGVDLNTFEFKSLAVPEGQTLSLVGGTLNLGAAEIRDGSGDIVEAAKPAYLHAPGGRVNLVSVASTGEAAFDSTTGSISVDGFTNLGDINIRGGSMPDIGFGPFLALSMVDGKEVFIRGGKLEMSEAVISPGVLSFYEPSPNGGEVNIAVTGATTIAGSGFDGLLGSAPGIYTRAGAFFAPQTFPDAKVPDITINAGSLTLSGIASVKTDRFGPGTAATVVVNADTVTVRDAASIVSLNFYDGLGGNIEINAREVNLSADGTTGPFGVTGIAAQNLIHPCFLCEQPDVIDSRLTSANAGSITVNATDSLNISGNALIVTDSLGFGRGGDIVVNAGDITVTGVGADTAGIKAQTALAGDAGNITIDATGTINLQNGGQIAGTTIGSGTGSNLVVTADKSITFSGADSRIVNATGPAPVDELNQVFGLAFGQSFEDLRDSLGLPLNASVFDVLGAFLNSLGFTPMPALTAGNAGTVSIATPLLTLNAGTRIEMSTGWEGNAGALTATVGSLFVNEGARISSRSGIERLTGEAVVGPGSAGAINITAFETISVSGAGSSISTTTFGDGAGGNVTLSANQVSIQNGGRVTSESGGILSGAVAVGSGNSGSVSISAGNAITVSGPGSTVSTTTFGDGAGGSVTLTAAQVNIQNGGQVASESGGTLGGALVVGAGNAGTVTINATGANTLTISGAGSTVSTSTLGAGDGGDVILTSAGDVRILDGGSVTADSLGGAGFTGTISITAGNSIIMDNGAISTRAVTSDGGNIKLTAPNIVYLNESQITTSVESGVGAGGNITIDPQFVIVNDSSIIANAFGGPGGNIIIIADNFLSSVTSVIEASSALSTPGVIEVRSPENNVENNIAQLPAAFIDASALLRGLCTARRTGAPSSFVVAGRGGIPVDADGYLPSFGTDVAAGLAGTGSTRVDAQRIKQPVLAIALLLPNELDCLR